MAIKEQYMNKWRRKNKDQKKKVNVADIVLVEHEHTIVTAQMESDIAYIEQKFVACAKQKNYDGKWELIKELQYRIIVRPYEDGKYALVSGRLQVEVLRKLNIQSAQVFVANVKSKEEFMEMLKNTISIKTMMPVKAIARPSVTVSEEEIMTAMAYLMKNKDFENEMVLDPFTYKVTKNPVNLYVAERIGLVDMQVKLEAK